MRIVIHERARKHGLADGQIRAAFESGRDGARIRERDAHAEPSRYGLIGFDSNGAAIELVAAILADGSVLIFHANYLTNGFLNEMRQAR